MIGWILGGAVAAASVAASTQPTAAQAPPPVITRPVPPPIVAPAPSVRQLPPPTAERLRLGRELATLAQPADLMVEAVQAGYDQGLKEDTSFAEIDKAIPGFGSRLASRGRQEIVRLVAESTPALQERTAAIYSSELTEDELKSFLEFFRSDAGKQMIRLMTFSDGTEVMDDDDEVSAKEMKAVTRAAVKVTVAKLDDPLRAALIRFSLSPAGLRSKMIGPKIQAATAEWMTALMTNFSGRIEAIAAEELAKIDRTAGK
jgi:hypothetical protein